MGQMIKVGKRIDTSNKDVGSIVGIGNGVIGEITGYYTDKSGHYQGYVVLLDSGFWSEDHNHFVRLLAVEKSNISEVDIVE